jgi:hypothetical protein
MAAGNEFWTDTIKRLKKTGKNKEVVAVCKENLPIPDAFGEMAIALRKQIRDRRKGKERFNDLLRQLYYAAVWQNFFADIDALCLMDQAKSCKVASQFIPRIKCDYNLIGYEHLDMLGVNDVKWLVEAWGEPKIHRPAREINQELHAQTVARYKLEKEREQRSAGRLFGGQQLKLTDPVFAGDGESDTQGQGADTKQEVASGSGNQRRVAALLLVVAVFILLIVLFMAA